VGANQPAEPDRRRSEQMTDSDERRVAKALQGAQFPAGKQHMID
jgi:hypothetical protein